MVDGAFMTKSFNLQKSSEQVSARKRRYDGPSSGRRRSGIKTPTLPTQPLRPLFSRLSPRLPLAKRFQRFQLCRLDRSSQDSRLPCLPIICLCGVCSSHIPPCTALEKPPPQLASRPSGGGILSASPGNPNRIATSPASLVRLHFGESDEALLGWRRRKTTYFCHFAPKPCFALDSPVYSG
jgi:hypothetical protein